MRIKAVFPKWFQVFILAAIVASSAVAKLPPWSYDPGPDPKSEMGKALIDLGADLPNAPAMAVKLLGEQKFRMNFGPVLWRMRQENTMKILFIGQDATHIAEAAGRTATAGFGGRAQDLARYLGVNENAGFINTYPFTIYGQYGAARMPYVDSNRNGMPEIFFNSFVNNWQWLLTHDQGSPLAIWRNRLIDWIVRNNRASLKMIVFFGGAARDAAGSFIESRGGKVGARHSEKEMAGIRIPEAKIVKASSNNEFVVPLDRQGKDLYEKIVGRDLDYSMQPDPSFDPNKSAGPDLHKIDTVHHEEGAHETELSETESDSEDANAPEEAEPKKTDQQIAMESLKADLDKSMSEMVFSDGGPYKNGLLYPAQLGGFDLEDISIGGGEATISLKGLVLSDGKKVDHDILLIHLPHPTVLSKMKPAQASVAVANALRAAKPFREKKEDPWEIKPDEGMGVDAKDGSGKVSQFTDGIKYTYGRADIGPEFYDFGAPKTRMVSVSSASRLNPNTIIFGSRNQPTKKTFDLDLIKKMTDASPETLPPQAQMFTARPRTPETRYVFDAGPGEVYAKIMKENLDLAKIFAVKPGKVGWVEKNKKLVVVDGIDAYYVKNTADTADYGHYRGTFESPRVLILADPDGVDDLITARALTGERGQYLQGLMRDMGVETDYLVIKTVPFGMDGATQDDWKYVLKLTEDYRKNLIGALLKNSKAKPDLVLSDGSYAEGIIDSFFLKSKIPIVKIKRGDTKDAGILDAAKEIARKSKFTNAKLATGKIADIPRKHLSYYARVWEGTSGDRVINAQDKVNRGLAFAEVAPKWAWTQEFEDTLPSDTVKVRAMLQKLRDEKLRLPGESVSDFLE